MSPLSEPPSHALDSCSVSPTEYTGRHTDLLTCASQTCCPYLLVKTTATVSFSRGFSIFFPIFCHCMYAVNLSNFLQRSRFSYLRYCMNCTLRALSSFFHFVFCMCVLCMLVNV